MKKTVLSYMIITLTMLSFGLLRNHLNSLGNTDLQVLIFPLYFVVMPSICGVIIYLNVKKIAKSFLQLIICFAIYSLITAIISGFTFFSIFREIYIFVFTLPMFCASLFFNKSICEHKAKSLKFLIISEFVAVIIVLSLVVWFISYHIIATQTVIA